MCGEHSWSAMMAPFSMGSSPHVRGAPVQHVDPDGIIGIIPACAGSTIKVEFHQSKGRDHPRMCGEHFDQGCDSDSDRGSSPHVRGAPRAAIPIA